MVRTGARARAARAYERFLIEKKNPKHGGKLPKNIQHQKNWKNTNHLGTTSRKNDLKSKNEEKNQPKKFEFLQKSHKARFWSEICSEIEKKGQIIME